MGELSRCAPPPSTSDTHSDFCQQLSDQYIGTATESAGRSITPMLSVCHSGTGRVATMSGSWYASEPPLETGALAKGLRRLRLRMESAAWSRPFMCFTASLPLSSSARAACSPACAMRSPPLDDNALLLDTARRSFWAFELTTGLGLVHCLSCSGSPVRLVTTTCGSSLSSLERPKAPLQLTRDTTTSWICWVPPMCARRSHGGVGTSFSNDMGCAQVLPARATLTTYSCSDCSGNDII
mmetsp:Transcript_33159/g.83598  ORF Transcript_33159/g.83598 Transcript_33159/m.83598 type:complete len:239 (+) Transcript_33159:998-1714(+)